MRGSIQKRGKNTYRVRVFLERDPATGKQVYHTKTIHGPKSDAEAYAAKIVHALEFGGELPQDRSAKFSDVLDTWWKLKQHSLNPRSFDQYEKELRLYIRPHFDHLKLNQITRPFLETTLAKLIADGMSATILRRVHMHVRCILEWAVREGKMSANPADGLKLPPIRPRAKIVFTPEQAATFVSALAQHPGRALFLLALETGLRPSEYLALRWTDIDWATGMLTVQRTVYFKRHTGWVFSDQLKTASSRRRLPLSALVIEALRSLPPGKPADLIFPNHAGQPQHVNNVRRLIFRPLLKAAGLDERMRLYDLRHSCATLLLDAATNVRVVAERLGHSSAATTLAVYAHVLPGRQHAATDTLSQIFGHQVVNNPAESANKDPQKGA